MVEKNVSVKVPGLSGFDKSHRVTSTLECGTITPIVVDELIPGSKVRLKLDMAAQLPPLVSDTYMRVKLKAEAFFCPSRILCKSYEAFYSDFAQRVSVYGNGSSAGPQFDEVKGRVPVLSLDATSLASEKLLSNDERCFGPGSLMDFLGFNGTLDGYPASEPININLLPIIAYHKIWEEWYRNPRIQNPAFAPTLSRTAPFVSAPGNMLVPFSSAPFIFFSDETLTADGDISYANYRFYESEFAYSRDNVPVYLRLADGWNPFILRQRNFPLDLYTSAMPSPQQGEASRIIIESTPGATTEGFTIAALRGLNSLQQFKERNNIPSPRMVDQTRARYGVNMSDGVAQRPLCLGTAEYDVYSKGVDQTAVSESTGANPFNSVGAQYGRAFASGSDFIIDDFEAKEPGYLFVMVTLVPYVSYDSGVNPLLSRYVSAGSITDMANPILQNVGPEVIASREISPLLTPEGLYSVFGYRERYGAWKDMRNTVHGLMRDGESLESFVLKRSITRRSTLNSDFLEIPKSYLDSVFAVSSSNMGFACWFDSMIDYKVVMPLAHFSVPSLQDPAYEHGETITLRKNGQVF